MNATGSPELDVFMHGTTFFDMVLTGLPSLPQAGTEMDAIGMGSCPGGVANLAVAASRLGLRTGLASTFGDDSYGDFLWSILLEEGVDLSRSRRITEWHSPVTVSLAVNRDRAMITHAHDSPIPTQDLIPEPPPCAAAVVDLTEVDQPWVRKAHEQGTRIFGDVGWDASGSWPLSDLDGLQIMHAFLPNSAEAMAYTRTEDPRAALLQLADLVPVVVVTCGGQGSIGIDSLTGEEEWVPSLPVNAVDATGAGVGRPGGLAGRGAKRRGRRLPRRRRAGPQLCLPDPGTEPAPDPYRRAPGRRHDRPLLRRLTPPVLR